MAKKQKGTNGVQNRPAYTRVSFLYQAAALLSTPAKAPEATTTTPSVTDSPEGPHPPLLDGMSRRLATQLRQVGLKTQIRIGPAVKRTLCKFCDTLLVEGRSCTSVVENQSRGGQKPWADVLVVKCGTCGGEKRFPVAAPRQKRRPLRPATEVQKTEDVEMQDAEKGA